MELLQFEITNAGTLGSRWTPPAPETKKASSLPGAALAALLQEEDDEDDWGGDAPDMSVEFARLGHLNEEADTDANADEPSDEPEPAAPTAPRSHTFTYTVTESGSAPGVTNDANATRKVSYTVTDDGAGHLSVVRDGGDGAAFTFTNTYSVTPTDSVAVSYTHLTLPTNSRV